jgi:hypothetical protein
VSLADELIAERRREAAAADREPSGERLCSTIN